MKREKNMIYKVSRPSKEESFVLKLADKNGNDFALLFGGNLDLYCLLMTIENVLIFISIKMLSF